MKHSVRFFILFLVASQAYASHMCVGKVHAVDVAFNAAVNASIGNLGDGNTICYLNKAHGEYTAEACKAVFSLLLSAKMSSKDVRLWFRNDTNTSCTKGAWVDLATHNVYHVRLEN